MKDKFCPQIIENYYVNNLYCRKDNTGYFVLGNLERDAFFLIKQEKYDYYQKLFKHLNGKNSIEDLEQQGFGSKESICNAIRVLEEKNFIKDKTGKNNFSEAELFSIKLNSFFISNKNEAISKICRFIVESYIVVFIIATFFLYYSLSLYLDKCITYNKNPLDLFMGVLDLNGYLRMFLLAPFIFIIHEIGHRITGICFGLNQGEVSICMFWGFIPMIYIKQRGIYSLERNKAIKVICSGIAANLLIGIGFLAAAIYRESEFLLYFAISNFKLIYINLLPLSLTDGYFLLCILFKTPNLRMFMYRFLVFPKSICKLSIFNQCMVLFLTVISATLVCLEIFSILFFLHFKIRIIVMFVLLLFYYLLLKQKGKKYYI